MSLKVISNVTHGHLTRDFLLWFTDTLLQSGTGSNFQDTVKHHSYLMPPPLMLTCWNFASMFDTAKKFDNMSGHCDR